MGHGSSCSMPEMAVHAFATCGVGSIKGCQHLSAKNPAQIRYKTKSRQIRHRNRDTFAPHRGDERPEKVTDHCTHGAYVIGGIGSRFYPQSRRADGHTAGSRKAS
jgi:hypothetical protein